MYQKSGYCPLNLARTFFLKGVYYGYTASLKFKVQVLVLLSPAAGQQTF